MGVAQGVGELTYGLDENGNRVEIGYPGGVTATLTYDFADRPATLDVDPGTGTPEPVVTSSSYLPSGPLSGLTLGNGTTESRVFDGRYAPTEILLDAPNPHRWSYTTDGIGNVTQITETTGCLEADLLLENQTVTTTQDFQNCAAIEAGPAFAVESPGDVTMTAGTRVVLKDGFSVGSGARFVAGTDSALAPVVETKTFTYQDVQYFLTGAELPWTSLAWSYDRIGNRLTETRDGVTDAYAYVANAGGGNTAILDQVSLGVGGARDYTFGAAGHLEEVAAGANVVDFTSDSEGRLVQVSRTGGSSSPFIYDGRSFLTEAGDLPTVGVTRPVYSSDGLVMALRRQASAAEPELVATILYFAGRPVAQIEIRGPETRWWYFTTDHLGTPQVATDEAGAELWSNRLEPFGRDSLQGTPDGALESGVFLRLPGQWETDTWQDAALGADIYYNVHRWYQPGVGRYNRPDPMGIVAPSGLNQLYSYAMSRPLFLLDPNGLEVVIADDRIQQTYDQLRGCFPFFRVLSDIFEHDRGFGISGPGSGGEVTWFVKDPPFGLRDCNAKGPPSEQTTFWIPAELDCESMMRCFVHEFYEVWLIDKGGFRQSGPAGPADNRARAAEDWIPFNKCCPCGR